ncbi:MAG: hypothetical protein M9915_09640 [Rhizobacter sp.]|nr:hypothetical protein [Burkholderiaceae bacterium]MCO5123988.1 hypothetical protein [Rhizobacter sp.]
MSRLLFLAVVLAATALFTGCSTLADAQAARGTGESRIYDRPYEVVWIAASETVRDSGLTLVSEEKEKGLILARGGVSAFSWGENVAVFVEDIGGRARTRVEVSSKRALATNITAKNWETKLLESLDKKLK